jgi:tRNA(fMet)-specific endonuclease VapC
MHILDTDTLTHLHAGHPRVAANLQKLQDPHVAITIITKVELLRGRIDYLLKADSGEGVLRAYELLARTEELLAQVQVLPFDAAAAAQFDRLRVQSNLRKVGRADLLIASIALAQRATVVTRNIRHFRQFAALAVVNWVD